MEAIAGILALIDKVLPPTINYETPDPECNLLIVREACECDVKTVLSNSFGFGGSNASILMREYPWEK